MLRKSLPISIAFIFLLTGARRPESHPAPAGSPAATTQPAAAVETGKGATEKEAVQGSVEKAAVTEHEMTIAGQPLRYRATAANMLMKDEDGKLKATMFFVAYERRDGAELDPARRPITFVFNGGPGAAAVWLHLGTAGPHCIALNAQDLPDGPPYHLIENASTWLDVTDLVFVDPVGTGYSRPAQGEKGEQFYGVQEDIRSVADFIRLYITQYQRWPSPKFLAGESYGTTRAAGLSEHLLDRYGIALNGITLISSVLNFATLNASEGNDLPYPLMLPSYTAVAWFHKRLAEDLQADLPRTLGEVEAWARGQYVQALARGSALPAEQRQEVIQHLARYTSLPAELIERADLRIKPGVFQKHLLIDQRKITGRYDGRITGFDLDPLSEHGQYDPSASLYFPAYNATFNDYVRRSLKYENVLPYEVLSERVHPWKFGQPGAGYLYVADDLRSAMAKNPHMKVMFCSGYFDTVTPYLATIYTVDELNLSTALRANITLTSYYGGHMMYHHQPSRAKLHENVAAIIRSAVPTSQPE